MAYSPDEGESWQLLEASLDTDHNLASAQMPGEGIYALISTIYTPLSDSGWFAYLGQSKPTTEALASIEGYYSLVAHHDSQREEEWLYHDPNVAPEFADLVNKLTELELEKSYFIHVTEPITLYVGTPDLGLHRMPSTNNQAPPALFYGWITPSASFTPTVGMPVQARLDGKLCGESTIRELDGQLAYHLQVAQNSHCDVDRGQILFEVGDWLMAHNHPWDNRRAWFHPLTSIAQPTEPTRLFLPLILRK